MKQDQVILVVSFGTSCAEAIKAIQAVEDSIAHEFPGYCVRHAYTSCIVRERLKEKGIIVPGLKESLERLAQSGVRQVWLQPTHIIPGGEYEKLCLDAAPFCRRFEHFALGRPLLDGKEDCERAVAAMKEEYHPGEGETLIFMGHGSSHPADRIYGRIREILSEEEEQRYFIAAMEGSPALCDVWDRQKEKVTLVPFMLTAGEHAARDMAGNGNSWKSVLEQRGHQVRAVRRGMGECPGIRRMYVEKVRRLVESGDFLSGNDKGTKEGEG